MTHHPSSFAALFPFRGLGAVSVVFLALGSCVSSGVKIGEVNKDSNEIRLQVSQDDKSILAERPAGDAAKARRALLDRKEQTRELLASVAELSLLAGNLDEAEKDARNALKKDVQNITAHKTLMKVYLAKNQADKALLVFDNAIAMDKKDADLHALRGYAFYLKENVLAAREAWKAALKLDPNNVAAQMNLGVLYFHFRNMELAGAAFDKVIAMQPNHVDARLGRALVWSMQGNAENSRKELHALVAKFPDRSILLYNLAVIERDRFQNYEVALQLVEKYLRVVKQQRNLTERGIALRHDLKQSLAKGKAAAERAEEAVASAPRETVAQSTTSAESANAPVSASESIDSLEDALK